VARTVAGWPALLQRAVQPLCLQIAVLWFHNLSYATKVCSIGDTGCAFYRSPSIPNADSGFGRSASRAEALDTNSNVTRQACLRARAVRRFVFERCSNGLPLHSRHLMLTACNRPFSDVRQMDEALSVRGMPSFRPRTRFFISAVFPCAYITATARGRQADNSNGHSAAGHVHWPVWPLPSIRPSYALVVSQSSGPR
jgi:hypothetical protein